MDHISLDLVDTDEQCAAAERQGNLVTRAGFFRRAAIGGGALATGGLVIAGMPSVALGAPSARQDAQILNFALLLEYLEAEFYRDAIARGALSGELLEFAQVVGAHEDAHVEFLREALGSAAIDKPTFDFKGTTADATRFVATSIALEDTGVAAYNGQGTRLTKPTLAVAATIVSVEARHAAWIRRIAGQPDFSGGRRTYPAPSPYDPALTMRAVEEIVESTGFITGS